MCLLLPAGLLGVPGGAAGSILASVLIKKLRMTCMQMLKWMFVLTVILSFLNVIFLVQCDDLPFAGVNTRYTSYNSRYTNQRLSITPTNLQEIIRFLSCDHIYFI